MAEPTETPKNAFAAIPSAPPAPPGWIGTVPPGWPPPASQPSAAAVPSPYPEPVGDVCRICGSQPAAPARFSQNTGMILMWRTRTYQGPFCRTCGTEIFRARMDRTLLTGWWGLISFFANLVVIVKNLSAQQKLQRLSPPCPTSVTGARRPLLTGPPIWRRPGLWVASVGVPVLLLIVLPWYLGR